ncbi:MAG: DUF1444 family protein [Ardenticatenaceae bacterium]|nr:DUF1444 family protein [Ardenticatenaceae bacterium]HBY96212.1 DUF1444 domain-containing protein [Chloroflexota bacterium]
MSQLLDQESFAAYVEDATRRAGFAIEKREGAVLYVILRGSPLRCDLAQVYRAYLSAPHRLDAIVRAHLDALRRVPPPPPELTEKEAAESLLPILQRAQWLKQLGQRSVPPVVHRPFVAGLVVTYVFDFPDRRAYVNADQLDQMMSRPGITFDMIHEYALENLRVRTTSRSYATHGLRDKTMIMCETRDGYAATRILLPDLMAGWAERIPGRMLIGIPNRDFLIAFSDCNLAHVRAITRQVHRDAARHSHPLSADLLVWRDGQVREYRARQ